MASQVKLFVTGDRIKLSSGKRRAELVSLGFRALREDSVKVCVVRLLVEAKGTDMVDEFGEERG